MMEDKLRTAIYSDVSRLPEFLDLKKNADKNLYSVLSNMFGTLLPITDKINGKMVFMPDEDVDDICNILILLYDKLYSIPDSNTGKCDKHFYHTLQRYRQICLDNEYFEYLKTIDLIINMYNNND